MKAYALIPILSLAVAGVGVTPGNEISVGGTYKQSLSSGAALAQVRARLEAPVGSGDATRIAFCMTTTGANTDWNIYVTNSDGSGQRQLTHTGAWDAAWSPDGSTIAFVSIVDARFQISGMAIDGSRVRPLTTSADENFHPAWSPRSDRLAFVCRANTISRFCVMKADGSSIHALTPADQQCRWPAWSPDGRRIAYNVQGEVWTIDTATHERVRLLESQTGASTIDWSPDGRQILFAASTGDQARIEVFDLSSGQTRRILCGDWQPGEPRWSPDGKRVLFLSRGSRPGIYCLDLSNANVRKIVAVRGEDDLRFEMRAARRSAVG